MSAIRELAVRTIRGFYEVRAPMLAASLSYFSLATMAPLGVLTLTVATPLLGRASAREQVGVVVDRLLGPGLGRDMLAMLSARTDISTGRIAGLIALGFVIYSASGLFRSLRLVLDETWEIPPSRGPQRGRHPLLRSVVLFGAVFLPAVALAVLAFGRAAVTGLSRLAGLGGGSVDIASIVLQALGPLIAWAVVGALFTYLPDARIAWRSALVGASFTTVSWFAGTWLLGLYLRYVATTSRFGAAGSLIALLLWVFAMSQLLLAGARLAYEHASMSGSPPALPQATGSRRLIAPAAHRLERGQPADDERSSSERPTPGA